MDFRPTELCKRIVLEGQKKVSGGCQLAGHWPLPGTARPGLSAHGQMKSIERGALVTGDVRSDNAPQDAASSHGLPFPNAREVSFRFHRK